MNCRIAYRAGQFWRTLFHPGKPLDETLLAPYLTPDQVRLFQRMHPAEQAHAFGMLQRLEASGQTEADLLTAALLHDVGKVRAPLTLFERVLIVLGRGFFPRASVAWGAGDARGWRRPFVVAALHPVWGADLAAQAGVSAAVCDLIRRHQDPPAGEDLLLIALQKVDDTD